MKLFIPTIGTQFILNKDWTFPVMPEYRNYDFCEKMNLLPPVPEHLKDNTFRRYSNYWAKPCEDTNDPINWPVVTIPKGCILTVARIYIRNAASMFDSVTFRMKNPAIKKSKSHRFWARLDFVNGIDVEVVA